MLRDFDLQWHQEAGLLRWMRALDFVFPGDEDFRREFRQGRKVQVEVTLVKEVVVGVSGTYTF